MIKGNKSQWNKSNMSLMKGNHLSFSQLLFNPRFLSSHTYELTDATSIYGKISVNVFKYIKIMLNKEN